MKVGLYFGSFNPIHNGHIGLAKYILEKTDVEEVWFVVTPRNPMKECSILISDALRVEMAQIATKNEVGVEVCEEELKLPQPNYTINTLEHLTKHYGMHEFSLIIGGDNMQIFEKWKDYDKILARYRVMVYPRDNSDSGTKILEGFEVLKDAPLFDVSSTEIRLKVARGERIIGMVGEEVEQYIREKGLYK